MAKFTGEQAFALAVQAHQAGRPAEAEAICRKILAELPEHADALHMLGVLAHGRANHAEAEELIRRAIGLDAANPSYHHSLAAVLSNRGMVLQASGQVDEAIADFREALRLRPGFPQAMNNLGNALLDRGQIDKAAVVLCEAVSLAPDLAEAHYNLGNALKEKEDLDGAANSYLRALALRADWSEALNNLGTVLKQRGQLDEAIECYRQASQTGGSKVLGNLLYAIHFHPDYDAARIRREHVAWNERFGKPLAPSSVRRNNDPAPERRLRIGYVSPDFRHHSQSFFTLPLLSHHDRAGFEVWCYSDVARPDDVTDQIRQHANVWQETSQISDEQLAETVCRDRIDILVDLTLHMSRNRLLAFARKPAPVQVTWLGYPGTTGLETMNYRLSDPYLDPPGTGDELYFEQTVRLPRTFWCYDPLTEGPDVGPLPALQNRAVTFGCLNGFYKVTAPTIETWARLLLATARSRLLLLAPHGSARERLLETMRGYGISADRIEFCDRMKREEYLAAYRRIDLCLDPIPCPGHTTTFDSLWMGIPVVTVAGTTAISRGGVSILTNAGLSEMVARSTEQYVRIATELANDPSRLAELRRTLRDRLRNSPLMDAERFARDLESVYRAVWRDWSASHQR